MQTPTFLQKTRSVWPSWHKLLLSISILIGLGASQAAFGQAAYSSDDITISASPTGASSATSITYTGLGAGTPKFDGAVLGNGVPFDEATGSLTVTAVTANLFLNDNTVVPSSTLYYRVYSSSAPSKPAFTAQALQLTSPTNNTNPVTYGLGSTTIDLLNQPTVLGGGTYTVEIIYESAVTFTSASGSTSTNVDDPGNAGGVGYKATFTVVAPPVTPNGGITTWISTSSTASGIDWMNKDNWSNGVPTKFADAVLPAKTNVNPTSTPLLSDPAVTYEVRTLTLNGTTNSTRALLRIGQSVADPLTGNTSPVGATLRVYGDLNNYSGGILAAVSGTNGVADSQKNSTIVLARNDGGFQVVRGALDIVDIRIEGTGIKAVVNEINASNTFTFATDPNGPGAIVQTSNDDGAKDPSTGLTITSPTLYVGSTLNTTKTAKVNLKDSGYLVGETATSYVRGITLADRSLVANTKQTFGNIGIDITPNRDIPSPNVSITRTVGDPLFGPLGNTSTAPAGSPQPVKRQYGVSGDVNNNTTSTITFHYLNSTDELNGNPEANLTIFKTGNNAPPYTLVGRTSAVLAGPNGEGTVTREGFSGTINTITLGDQNNPLPIQLSAFNAVRNGSNALLTWATATESNNKGFNVQVSADGATYRTLSFVASQSTNSSLPLSYKYTDMEPSKTGTRYYRLQQVDVDGKSSYSPVRAISFNGSTATDVALVAYPNPMNSNDNLGLQLQGGSIVNGLAYVKLVDMAGRTVSDQQLQIIDSSLSLGNLGALTSGLYMAKVTLPDGSTKTVRIQRQ
jgi:hypothetical protein